MSSEGERLNILSTLHRARRKIEFHFQFLKKHFSQNEFDMQQHMLEICVRLSARLEFSCFAIAQFSVEDKLCDYIAQGAHQKVWEIS